MERDATDMPTIVAATTRRTGIAGALCAAVLAWVVSPHFGLSVAAGAALGAGNFALIAIIARRMFDRNLDREPGEQTGYRWGGMLVAKMTLLLVAAALLVLYVGIDPIGLAVGFTVFVISAIWSAAETARSIDD